MLAHTTGTRLEMRSSFELRVFGRVRDWRHDYSLQGVLSSTRTFKVGMLMHVLQSSSDGSCSSNVEAYQRLSSFVSLAHGHNEGANAPASPRKGTGDADHRRKNKCACIGGNRAAARTSDRPNRADEGHESCCLTTYCCS